jgi:hypothetical protein
MSSCKAPLSIAVPHTQVAQRRSHESHSKKSIQEAKAGSRIPAATQTVNPTFTFIGAAYRGHHPGKEATMPVEMPTYAHRLYHFRLAFSGFAHARAVLGRPRHSSGSGSGQAGPIYQQIRRKAYRLDV